MKANEAPEKIHIQPNAHDRWFEGNIPNGLPNGLFVEYTRTDAFVEKMQLFLIDKLKEIPMGGGKMKIKSDCSLEEFIEEFKKAIECIENYVNSFPHSQRPEIWQHINFLKSFKGRVQPKQEWSEEDEIIVDVLYAYAEKANQNGCPNDAKRIEAAINKLKSLRPKSQWKPSDEQIYTLEKATHIVGSKYKSCLSSLYQELKKLREE